MHRNSKFVLLIVLFITQINRAQIQNNATVHIGNHSILYIGSGDFNFGVDGTTSTSRTTDSFGKLVFANGTSSNDSAENNHFIDGYARTESSSPFIMNIGQNDKLASILIDANTATGIDGVFYGSTPVDPSSLGTDLVAISEVGYWDINGATTAFISLSWRNYNTIENGYSLADYAIVGYNGSSWELIDATVDATSFFGTTSTTTSGSITSNNLVSLSDYEAFTIGIRDNCTELAISSGNTKTWNGS
jgi:hypothetical protein